MIGYTFVINEQLISIFNNNRDIISLTIHVLIIFIPMQPNVFWKPDDVNGNNNINNSYITPKQYQLYIEQLYKSICIGFSLHNNCRTSNVCTQIGKIFGLIFM